MGRPDLLATTHTRHKEWSELRPKRAGGQKLKLNTSTRISLMDTPSVERTDLRNVYFGTVPVPVSVNLTGTCPYDPRAQVFQTQVRVTNLFHLTLL